MNSIIWSQIFLCRYPPRVRTIFGTILTLCLIQSSLPQNCPSSSSSLGQLCLIPSIGPTGGGTTITVKGFQSSAGQNWGVSCLYVNSWVCYFVVGGSQTFKSQGIATSADCIAGQVRCPVPSVPQPNDYIFYVAAMSISSGKSSTTIYPITGSLPLFSFFGEFIPDYASNTCKSLTRNQLQPLIRLCQYLELLASERQWRSSLLTQRL